MAEGPRFFDGTTIQYFSGDDIAHQSDDFVRYIETRLLGLQGIKPTDVGLVAGTPVEVAAYNAYLKYETQLIGHFASFLISGANEWFKEWTVAHPNENWLATKTAFIIEFNTERNKYYAQTEAKNIAMKPQEHINQFYIRVKKLCNIGWHGKGADVIELKIREIFLDGLPQDLRNKAQDRIITQPTILNSELVKVIEQKAVSRAISSRQSLNATAVIEDQLHFVMQELKEMKTTQSQNAASQNIHVAAYDPNKPRFKQNAHRFCKFCRKSGHTVEYCNEKRRQAEENRPNGRPNAQTRFQTFFPTNGTNSTQPQGQFRPRNYTPQRQRFIAPVKNQDHTMQRFRKPEYNQQPVNTDSWGFNYPPWKRNTGNPIHDQRAFRHRLDNGYGPPRNKQDPNDNGNQQGSSNANMLQRDQSIEEEQSFSVNMVRNVMPNQYLN